MTDPSKDYPGWPFQRFQARALLRDKYVLVLGDSVQRAVYKGENYPSLRSEGQIDNRRIYNQM